MAHQIKEIILYYGSFRFVEWINLIFFVKINLKIQQLSTTDYNGKFKKRGRNSNRIE